MRAPGIAVTAAPGVAFAYHYAFRLPSERISKVQEAHAQACEKLGISRCRITGMRYRLIGENNIEAMLAFKLDPAIARGFGKDGIAAVDAAQGRLVDAEVTGTDAGSEIKRLDVQRSRVEEEIARLDRELANPKLKSAEREELQRQRADYVQNRNATKDSTADQQASLATTPMVFDYGSGRSGARVRYELATDQRGRHCDRVGASHAGGVAGHPRAVRAACAGGRRGNFAVAALRLAPHTQAIGAGRPKLIARPAPFRYDPRILPRPA